MLLAPVWFALSLSAAAKPAAAKPAPAPAAAAAPAAKKGEIALANGGFEAPAAGEGIAGWTLRQHAGAHAYTMELDTREPFKGKASFRMERTAKQVFGAAVQTIPVPKNAVGHKIELSAALRSAGVGKRGWVSVLTFENGDGIIDQQRSAPLTGDTKWTTVKIATVVPQGTQKIEVGVMLLDEGTGWADELALRLVD